MILISEIPAEDEHQQRVFATMILGFGFSIAKIETQSHHQGRRRRLAYSIFDGRPAAG